MFSFEIDLYSDRRVVISVLIYRVPSTWTFMGLLFTGERTKRNKNLLIRSQSNYILSHQANWLSSVNERKITYSQIDRYIFLIAKTVEEKLPCSDTDIVGYAFTDISALVHPTSLSGLILKVPQRYYGKVMFRWETHLLQFLFI